MLKIVNRHFDGSVAMAADAFGVTTQAVYQWIHHGIPPMRAYHIQSVLSDRKPQPKRATA